MTGKRIAILSCVVGIAIGVGGMALLSWIRCDRSLYRPSGDKAVDSILKARVRAIFCANAEAAENLITHQKGAAQSDKETRRIQSLVGRIEAMLASDSFGSGNWLKGGKCVPIRADDERGTLIGAVTNGATLALQYEKGLWTEWNGQWVAASPDERARNTSRVGVYASKTMNLAPVLLVAVPEGTADRPFMYQFTNSYSRVFLRVTGMGNLFSQGAGSVTYLYQIPGK